MLQPAHFYSLTYICAKLVAIDSTVFPVEHWHKNTEKHTFFFTISWDFFLKNHLTVYIFLWLNTHQTSITHITNPTKFKEEFLITLQWRWEPDKKLVKQTDCEPKRFE